MATGARKPIQVNAGRWYAIASGGEPYLEECCDCALVHRIEYRVKNGRIWQRWLVDDRATRKARKRPQKFSRTVPYRS